MDITTRLDTNIDTYESMAMDGSNLPDMMQIAREIGVDYYKIQKLKAEASKQFHRYHVMRRIKFAKHVKELVASGEKVTAAKELAQLKIQEIYNKEYKFKTDKETMEAYISGVDEVLRRMNQDISRLKQIEVDDNKIQAANGGSRTDS